MPAYMPCEDTVGGPERSSYAGTAAELAVRSWLTFNGRTSAVPEVDREGVDLWVDGHRRAQVKKVVRRGPYGHSFFWQSTHRSRRKYSRGDIDLFYQVIMTDLRLLIFEIPSTVLPVKSSGEFAISTEINLCGEFHQRKVAAFDPRNYCVHRVFAPALLTEWP
jgi:hypothetical protein